MHRPRRGAAPELAAAGGAHPGREARGAAAERLRARAWERPRLPATRRARGRLCRRGDTGGEGSHLLYRGVEERAVAAQVQLVVEHAIVPEGGQAVANGPDPQRT